MKSQAVPSASELVGTWPWRQKLGAECVRTLRLGEPRYLMVRTLFASPVFVTADRKRRHG